MSHPTDPKTGQPIFRSHGVGLRNVPSYQISGHPYVSGSGDGNGTAQAARTIKRFQFPFVSRDVTIRTKPVNYPGPTTDHMSGWLLLVVAVMPFQMKMMWLHIKKTAT